MSKPKTMFVKPAASRSGEPLIVRDPRTMRPLPAAGARVPQSQTWVRAVLAGDVIRVEEPGSAPTPPPEEPAPAKKPKAKAKGKGKR